MPPVRLTPLRLISAALLSVTTTLHALQLPVRQYCPCYRTTGIRQPSRSMTSPHSTVRHRRTRAAHCWRTSDRNALPDGIERTARGACGVCLPNSSASAPNAARCRQSCACARALMRRTTSMGRHCHAPIANGIAISSDHIHSAARTSQNQIGIAAPGIAAFVWRCINQRGGMGCTTPRPRCEHARPQDTTIHVCSHQGPRGVGEHQWCVPMRRSDAQRFAHSCTERTDNGMHARC